MGKKLATKRNLLKILIRIGAMCVDDADTADYFIGVINTACDRAGDLFGTEGQRDPRGDQRD